MRSTISKEKRKKGQAGGDSKKANIKSATNTSDRDTNSGRLDRFIFPALN